MPAPSRLSAVTHVEVPQPVRVNSAAIGCLPLPCVVAVLGERSRSGVLGGRGVGALRMQRRAGRGRAELVGCWELLSWRPAAHGEQYPRHREVVA